MKRSETIGSLAAALAKAQADFLVPKKSHTAKVQTRTGGNYTYAYSTLDELLAAVRPALKAHELAVVQNVTMPDDHRVSVSTSVFHSSGEYIDFDPIVLLAGDTPQTVGAAITYARRYSLGTALNVAAEEDDDGQATESEPRRTVAPPVPPARWETSEPLNEGDVFTPPAGFHHVRNYETRGDWHEAIILRWTADGRPLKVSTKLLGIGKLLAKAAQLDLPIKPGITMKKDRPDEAYLNSVVFYDAEQPDSDRG